MSINIERSEQGFIAEEETVAAKIDIYKVKLGLTTEEVAGLKKDVLVMKHIAQVGTIVTTSTQSINAYKRNIRNGISVGDIPLSPAFPIAPDAVETGIEKRFRDLCHKIVSSPNYTEDIGKDLGILAPDVTEDVTLATPAFTIDFTVSGHPIISWKKSGFTTAEIWKSIDGINFVRLERVSATDYIDHSTLPALNKSEVWSYKMIYLQKDIMIGKWSNVVAVAVLGH